METNVTKTIAIIQGGTSGMGLATAHRLAARGIALVLIGRNPDKLASARA
ncbi:MAG: SDR family NAD(P)-dependent oxidoreductase, partial [Pseudomonadota bacterium]